MREEQQGCCMLSEAALSTVVQFGITGAGLMLAIYALIIPIYRRMFKFRALMLRKRIKLFEEQRKNLTPEATSKEFKRLQQSASDIKVTKIFPRYLSIGVLLTFTLYIVLAIIGFGALINPIYRTQEIEIIITSFFAIANVSFLTIGVFATFDISETMIDEYERIKKNLEKDKKKLGNGKEFRWLG